MLVLKKKLIVPTVRELIRIAINRKDWQNLSPRQKWCFLYGIGRASFKPVGYTLYTEDQTLHWNSFLIVGFMAVYTVLAAFAFVHYIIQGELSKWLPCTLLLIILAAASPLLISMLTKDRYPAYDLGLYSAQHIYTDCNEDDEYNRICLENIDESVRSFFTKMGILLLSYSTMLIGPTYVYFAHGIRTTLSNLKFPFIPEDSDLEFGLNVFGQTYICVTGILGYIGLEVIMSLMHDAATASPRLLEYELKKFDKMIAKKRLPKLKLDLSLKKIIEQAIRLDDLITDIGEVMYYRTLLTPTLFQFGIAVAIFCQFTLNYAAGYGGAVMSYCQLFYMCELGEIIEDNGFADIIYSSHWYNMPVDYQKDIPFLIHRKQNGVKITVGPFGVINRELTAAITRKIYSLVMFLNRFSK